MLAVLTLTLPIGCKKSSDQQSPAQRKPYAWAIGTRDSTKYALILFSPDGGGLWVVKYLANAWINKVSFIKN